MTSLTDIPRQAAPPLLLSGSLHRTSLAAESLDFQIRVGRPLDGAAEPAPCALVLTRTADREIDELSLGLAAAGVPLLRLDSDRADAQALCWDPEREVLVADGRDLRPSVCWSRYFTAASIPATGRPATTAYARDQWWAAAVALAACGGRILNRAAGPDRLAQLAGARAAGLVVPRTVVTTHPARDAARIAGDGDVIVKAVGEHYVEPVPGALTGLTPRRVARVDLPDSEPAPVLVQELVEAPRELRVYVVAGTLHAFAVTKTSLSALWEAPEELAIEPTRLQAGLADTLTRLSREWRLDVAAFDLLDAPGAPVFLEVNAACDWLWCERATGTSAVSDAVRRLIEDEFGGDAR
jgi:hypothetical protein